MKRKSCLLVILLWAAGSIDRLPAALTDGLVGYWPLDDRQGTNVADLSGWGRNGVLLNVPPDGSAWVAGKVGGAINLSGAASMVVNPMPPPTHAVTFSAWIWADSPPGGNIAFCADLTPGGSDAGVFGFSLIGPDLRLTITETLSPGGSAVEGPLGGPIGSLQSWHHVGFVGDGNFLSIWLDGQITGLFYYVGNFIYPTPPAELILGQFHGKIDDAALWLRALTDDEIMDLYQAGLAGRPVIGQPTEVVAWGDDSFGQIDVPSPLTNVMQVAAGPDHNFAVKRDGTVVGWGVLPGGIATTAGFTGMVAIAAGNHLNLALSGKGTVIEWGHFIVPNIPDYFLRPYVLAQNGTAVAAGDFSDLVLRADGKVQMGDWTGALPGLSNVVAIAAGGNHLLALKTDGTVVSSVVSWNVDLSPDSPVPDGLSKVVGIGAGATHSLAVKADGTVIAWGDNSHGQTDVPPGLTRVAAVAAGDYHSVALRQDGTVVAWGDDSKGQIDVPNGLAQVVAIAAGAYHNLALVGTGPPVLSGRPVYRTNYTGIPFVMVASAVGLAPLSYQWQLNGTNLPDATNAFLILPQLGTNQAGSYGVVMSNALGTATATNTTLTAIETPAIFRLQPTNQISYPGGSVSFEALAEGTAPLEYQWVFNGSPIPGATNSSLSLTGLRSDQAGLYSVRVQNPVGTVASSNVTLSVGPVIAWGRNAEGETNLPPGLTNVIAAASGSHHSMALRRDGTVVAWGDNSRGQTNTPAGLANVTAIAAGGDHCLALKADGTVAAWGDNRQGQTTVPPGLQQVVAIAAGGSHSLALIADGEVIAWGDNSRGQTNVPLDLSNVMAIAAGGAHNLALRASGKVVAWGDDTAGQASVPLGLDNVLALSAGLRHSLALRSDGSVLAWGSNAFGAIQIPGGLSNVVAVAAGNDFNLALRADGVAVAWGLDDQGQTDVPSNLVDVVGIAAGAAHSLVLTGDGSLVPVGTPTSRAAYTDTVVILNAGVVGAGPLSYQWRLNGANLSGATHAFLTLPEVHTDDSAKYTVVVSNAVGSLNRELELAVVESKPVVIGQPTDQITYPGGGSATFQVHAEGSGLLSYQWFFGGAEMDGATNNPLTLNAVRLAQGGQYSVLVSNPYGTTHSRGARLSVGPVVEWGDYRDNSSNSLAVSASVPVALTNAVAIAGGYAHSLALTDQGNVIAWGEETNLAGLNTAFGQTRVYSSSSNSVAIAAGGFNSLAVKADGTVVGWGDNRGGQTLVPSGLNEVVAVASGYQNFSLGLKADGRLTGWGNVPAAPDLHGVVEIAAGGTQGLALMEDGSVVVWPPLLGSIPHDLTNIIGLAAGQWHSLALRADGRVVAWGSGPGTNVPPDLHEAVAIAAGAQSGLALKVDGTLTAWGNGPRLPVLTNVLDIAAGPTHNLALVGEGTLVRVSELHLARLRWVSSGDSTWFAQTNVTYDGSEALRSGFVAPGQQSRLQTRAFGPGTLSLWWKTSSEVGKGVLSFSLDGVEQDRISGVTDWAQRAYVLSPGFHRLEWDYSKDANDGAGQDAGWLARLRFTPRGTLQALIPAPPLSITTLGGTDVTLRADFLGVEPVSLQWQFNGANIVGATNPTLTLPSIRLSGAGEYSVVLSNAYGQTVNDRATVSLIQVVGWGHNNVGQAQAQAGVSQIVAIAGGRSFNRCFSLALWQNGTVTAWGDPTLAVTRVPASATDGAVVAIAAGAFHALALKNDGQVMAWGENSRGEAEVPPGLTHVVAIAAGPGFSLALTREGRVFAWGDDAFGQTNVPAGLLQVVAIACGDYQGLALKDDGTVVAWGVSNDVPPGLTNAVAIAAGVYHSLALRADGTVIGWGANNHGQINIPATLDRVVAIAGGDSRSLALRSDGTVVGWGDNTYGQAYPPIGLSNVVALAAGSYHTLALLAEGGAPPPVGPRPRLFAPRLGGDQFEVRVPSVIGRLLGLEFTDSLTEPSWVASPMVVGDGDVKLLAAPAVGVSQRFYRVRTYP